MENTHKLKRPPAHTPPLYATESTPANEKLVTAHYFLPGTSADWYVVEFDIDEQLLFGWMEIVPDGEWGYSSLSELEGYVLNAECSVGQSIISFPVRVELDEYWSPQTMGEVLAKRP